MTPEQRQKLDSWISELGLAIGTMKMHCPEGKFDLEDLYKTLEQIREGSKGDRRVEALIPSKRKLGAPVDHRNTRGWLVFLSWIAAVKQTQGNSLEDFLPQMEVITDKAMIRGGSGTKKDGASGSRNLQRNFKKFKDGGGVDKFRLSGGIQRGHEEKMVRYLESQHPEAGMNLWCLQSDPDQLFWCADTYLEGWLPVGNMWDDRVND